MRGCKVFALTSWLQHVSPDEIFHKSAGTDVFGASLTVEKDTLSRWQNEDVRGMSCQ